MTRDLSRRHQDRVKTDIENRLVGICREPDFRGCGNPSALPFVDRFCSFGKAGASLDLGEHEEMTAPGNDIDFAQGASPSSR